MNDRQLFDGRYGQVSKSLVDTEIFNDAEYRHLADCLIYSIPTTDEYGDPQEGITIFELSEDIKMTVLNIGTSFMNFQKNIPVKI